MDKKELRATIFIFLTALIWGVAFTFQIVGMESMGPLTYNGVRFLIASISLIPVIAIIDRSFPSKEERKTLIKYGSLCGLVLFIAGNLQQVGMMHDGSAGKAGFITSLYIIIVPLFTLFAGKKPGMLLWIGAFLSLIGIYFISWTGGFSSFTIGDGLLFACAVFFALHIIVVGISVEKVKSPIQLSFVQFLVSGSITTLLALFTEDITFAGLKAGFIPLIYGGVISSGIAYTLQVVGQKHVPPTRAAIIFSLESFFAVLGAAIIIGESMTTRGYVGCAFIFTGVVISQLKISRKKKTDMI